MTEIYFSAILEAWKSKIKVLTRLVPGESSLLVCKLLSSHIPTCQRAEREEASSSYKGTDPSKRAPPTSSLITPNKDLSPNTITWDIRVSTHELWKGRNIPSTADKCRLLMLFYQMVINIFLLIAKAFRFYVFHVFCLWQYLFSNIGQLRTFSISWSVHNMYQFSCSSVNVNYPGWPLP